MVVSVAYAVSRNRVYLVGLGFPPELDTALAGQGFEVKLVTDIADALPKDPYDTDPRMRTIILQSGISDENRLGLTRAIRHCKQHLDLGFNVVIACLEAESLTIAATIISDQRLSNDERIRAVDLGTLVGKQLLNFCQVVASHDAGPPATRVTFEGDDPGDHRLLLSRSFHDFEEPQSVRLTKLEGGSAAVYSAEVIEPGRRYEPFIVKLADRRKIEREIANYRYYVELHVAFPHRPPIVHERCVAGLTTSTLVSWFASKSTRLDKRLQTTSTPAALIHNLFEGPLSTWRKMTRQDEGCIGQFYRDSGRLFNPNDDRLRYAYKKAQLLDAAVRSPQEVHKSLLNAPLRRLDLCYAHGDLHTRNVFVREPGNEVILIDFFATSGETIHSRDPATLDVAIAFLAFEPGNRAKRLADDVLRQLYEKNSLSVVADTDSDPRVSSIMAIRKEARDRCTDASQYDTSLGIFLFDAACRERSPLAYVLGDALLRSTAE
jgi:hypothetical protein